MDEMTHMEWWNRLIYWKRKMQNGDIEREAIPRDVLEEIDKMDETAYLQLEEACRDA